MKISIIGAGSVGGSTAMQLCSLGFDEIILVDTISNMARAKSFDLSDARFILKHSYNIEGTDDINQIANSQILVITAGITRKSGMKREELIQKNSQIIKGICQEIKRLCSQPIIIVVTNPLDAMTYLVIKETDLPVHRVLGMGLTLDSSRLANLIAEELNIPVTDVEPCIIGSHGAGMLPLRRYTKLKGAPINNHLKSEKIDKVFERTLKRGAEIVSLLEHGSAYFAPSVAISELIRVIWQDEKSILPVSVYLEGQYGLEDLCIGLPCRLGKNGIEEIIELKLNQEEKAAFLRSAECIREQISTISYQSKVKA